MSFIVQDQNLMKQLLRLAQAGTATPQDVATLKSIIGSLEQQLTADPNEGPVITTGNGVDASLNSTYMKNMSTLINFLGTAGVQVDGKNIVVGKDEMPNDPNYVPFNVVDNSMRPSRSATTMKVNKDLLAQYLVHLQKILSKKANPVMQAQVQTLIQEANEQLDTGVSKNYKEPAKVLRNDQVVDKVPQNFKVSEPLDEGNVPLTYADITSDTGFNAWIQKNNVGVDGRAYRHPQYDKCGLIKGLHARANSYVANATSAQDKDMYTIYAEEVTKLAAAFKCDLSAATQPVAQPGAGGVTPAAILQLAQELPLAVQDIDFSRIESFLAGYESLLANNTDPRRAARVGTVSTAIQQARDYMKQAQQNTINGNMTNFPINGVSAMDIAEWAVPATQAGQPTRSRGSAKALADFLDYTVRNVISVVRDFYSSYVADVRGQDIFKDEPQLRNAVESQTEVGASNLSNISSARARLPQVGT